MGLRAMLRSAVAGGYAVPACNVFDALTMDAALGAAERLGSPLVVQISTRTALSWGLRRTHAVFQALAAQRQVSAVLHLDHCTDPELVRECQATGWDSALFDASGLPVRTATELTRDLVLRGAARDFAVEGEIDRIPQAGEPAFRAVDVERCAEFVSRTGVACFGPAAGTVHGIPDRPPVFDWDGLRRLADRIDPPLVLHGGSGLTEPVLRRAIACGVAKVNVSTAAKAAYRTALDRHAGPRFGEPLDFVHDVSEAIDAVVTTCINTLGSKGKACGELSSSTATEC